MFPSTMSTLLNSCFKVVFIKLFPCNSGSAYLVAAGMCLESLARRHAAKELQSLERLDCRICSRIANGTDGLSLRWSFLIFRMCWRSERTFAGFWRLVIGDCNCGAEQACVVTRKFPCLSQADTVQQRCERLLRAKCDEPILLGWQLTLHVETKRKRS